MKQTTVNQRLDEMVSHFSKGNKSAFAKEIGISSQGLGEILGGRQSAPSFSLLQKLFAAYPQVRMEWLLMGQEPMLKGEKPSNWLNRHGDTITALQDAVSRVTQEFQENNRTLNSAHHHKQQAEALLAEVRELAKDNTPKDEAIVSVCELAEIYISDYLDVLTKNAKASRMQLANLHHRLAELMQDDAPATEGPK